MKKTFTLWLFVGLLFGAAQIANAQYTTTPQRAATTTAQNGTTATTAAEQGGARVVTMFGCMGRGATADEFSLYGQDATTWELKSNSVPLNYYLDQEVTVTAPSNLRTATALLQ